MNQSQKNLTDIPMIHFLSMANRKTHTTGIYNCPIYKVNIIFINYLKKVASRAWILSTTGHSTNFVIFMEMKNNLHESIWIKACVAAFLALRYWFIILKIKSNQ